MAKESAAVKVSLESLGLTLSNMPLHFRPSQEETKDKGMQNSQGSFVYVSEIDREFDSGSIVILGKNSLDAILTQSLAEYKEIHQTSMSIDWTSMISSLTAPEVEQKLTEVLQENSRLKEILEKNNLATKHILNIIAWKQEEVSKVYEEHKQQFAETKTLVNLLRAENNGYKMKIDELNRERANWSMQREESSRVHEEQKREFAEIKNLMNVLRTENYEYKMKMEELNKESTNKFMAIMARADWCFASMKLVGKNEKLEEENAIRTIITSLEQQLKPIHKDSCKSMQADDFVHPCNETMVENSNANRTDGSLQWLQLLICEEFLELKKLCEQKFEEANKPRQMTSEWHRIEGIFVDYYAILLEIDSCHEERKGLAEDKKLHDLARKKENEFFLRIGKLELEKNYLMKTMLISSV